MAAAWFRFDIRQMGRPIVTALLVWLLLNVAFLGLFVRPRQSEFVTLEQQSRPRLEALRQREAEVERLEGFFAALERAENDLVELRTRRLGTRERQMVPVQLELQRLAGQFKIELERVQYQNSVLEEEGLERFAMVVPLEAGYSSLRRFIQAVETSSKFLVIEKVALGQSREGGVMLELNITLATYFDAPQIQKRQEEERRRERSERRGAGRA